MKLTHLALATVGSAALFTLSTAKAQTLADWTLQSDAVATNNNPVADAGTGSAKRCDQTTRNARLRSG